jgi:hypothetical protein
MTMPVIWMIVTRQRHPTMKSTPCLTLKWQLLARIARPSFSAASHFFSAYELGRVHQKFLAADGFLVAVRVWTNSWEGSGKLKVFSFQILTKVTAYILSSLGFFRLFFY